MVAKLLARVQSSLRYGLLSVLYTCKYLGPYGRHASPQNIDFRVKLKFDFRQKFNFDSRVQLHGFRTFLTLNLRLNNSLRRTFIESNNEEEPDGFSKQSFVVSG